MSSSIRSSVPTFFSPPSPPPSARPCSQQLFPVPPLARLCVASTPPSSSLLTHSFTPTLFLASFLPITTISPSRSSFYTLLELARARTHTHAGTQRDLTLYYTPPLAGTTSTNRHAQLFLCASCLQEPPRMSNSLIRVAGRRCKLPSAPHPPTHPPNRPPNPKNLCFWTAMKTVGVKAEGHFSSSGSSWHRVNVSASSMGV